MHSRAVSLLFAATTALTITPTVAAAAPVQINQQLVPATSSIRFGVNSPSPSLQMAGTFTKFGGSLLLDPEDVTRSKVSMVLDLQSVQLPPNQILQAVFLQTALAQLRQPKTSFVSDSIEHVKGAQYVVTGNYNWQGKTKRTVVPVEIVRSGKTGSEVRVVLNGSTDGKNTPPELASIGGAGTAGSKGWARGIFMFAAR